MTTATHPADPASAPPLPAPLLAAIESAAFMQCLVTAELEALDGPISREQFAQECMRTGAALAMQQMEPAVAADAKRFNANRKAIHSLLQRIQSDSRLAYFFDQLTQSFEDLTEAHALNYELPLAQFRKDYASTLVFKQPRGMAGAA